MAQQETAKKVKPTISFDDFSKLDLRVGTVVECEEHPNADKLFKIQVDLGEELGRRQICAGIREHERPQDLINKQIVVLVNLEPRQIRGEESNGMLLAASAEEAGELIDVAVLTPRRPVPTGSQVS